MTPSRQAAPDRTVVIAGGGPTGLTLAGELALAGVPAVVLERRTEVPEHALGMAVHGRTLEVLELRGLADRLREQGIFAWPRTPFGFLWLDLGTVGPDDYTYGMPQWRTERVLADWTAGLGVEVRRGHEVAGHEQDAGGVTVTVRSADGDYQLRAAYLVGCDGAYSAVRQQAGIDFPPHAESNYQGLLGDVTIAEGELNLFDAGLHPGGVFGAIPIEPGVLRLMTVEFGVAPPADSAAPVTVAELQESIRRVVGRAPEVQQARFLARFGHPTTLVDRFRDGRVLLAGDAAHVLFVSGTQGLNAGIQDAVNLGWKLAADVNGWAPAGLLDTYHAERHPAALRACLHARAQLALMHPLDRLGPLRELFGELLRFGAVNRLLLEMPTAVRYPVDPDGGADGGAGGGPNSPAGDRGGRPLLGRPIPNVPLTTAAGETTTARALHRARGVLLQLTDDPAGGAPDSSPAAEVSAGWADRVDLVVARRTGDLDAATVLIRPDGHVAHVTGTDSPTDSEALRMALKTWFGEPIPAA